MRPLLLDLYCGAGGAAMGYHRAGFEVVGVDVEPQPRYPFTFYQHDAVKLLRYLLSGYRFPTRGRTLGRDLIAAYHASPPCQAYSALRVRHADRAYPELVEPTLELLAALGGPWVVENVRAAPLGASIMLCGSAFGLGASGRQLRRHRYFATSFALPELLPPCQHVGQAIGVYGGGPHDNAHRPGQRGGYVGSAAECSEAMGISWMTKAELAEAVPPAYTEHLGRLLMAEVMAVAA